ncbi:hypothetical protein [Fibrobacter sp.]|uniref:hypothetical protein n=1 Tax=Fibrobacter sp. TaxID=35828 RepID=UPI0025C21645|nr:hypothetical protein [Fibrobacter sp.]MBR3071237.1 hypothetical protein [Fibrobacter sp.]
MKLDCCVGAENALGVLLMAAFFLVGCASDGSVAAPDSQNAKNLNGNLSSVAESNGNSSSNVSNVNQAGLSKTVYGLAQNGPYVDSSVVKLTVLDESTLESTEQVFTGLVGDGYGGYSIQVDSLKSNIAQISVSGKYLEARSGRLSEKELTLYALSDLNVHNSINVNLFTTLEYERVRELVKNKKLSFAEAKKQAKEELLDAFHVVAKDETGNNVNFDDPEMWNIYGIRDIENRDEDKVLMGLTAIFSAFNENYVESLIKTIAEDFAKDGKWDDDSTRMRVANAAYGLNTTILSGDVVIPADIESIRRTMTRWRSVYTTGFDLSNLSGGILPDFESVVDGFWLGEYGLSKCAYSILGTVAKTPFGSYFTCKEDTRTHTGIHWLSSSVLETNTYGIKCDSTDYFKTETTDRTPRLYVCEFGKWREALDVEGKVGLCTSEKEGSLEDTDLFGYVCKSQKWEIFTDTLEDKRDGKRYAYRKAAGLYWMISNLQDTTLTWAESDKCPEGWRLPTEDEWNDLSKQLAGVTANGSQLNLVHVGEYNTWWSSTEKNDSLAVTANVWHHPRSYDESLRFTFSISALEKKNRAAIRCVKEP